MKIETDYNGYTGEWYAWDADSYDGAPDGNNTMGWGDTAEEAAEDLQEKLKQEAIND